MSALADVMPDKPTIHLDSRCLPAIKNWKVGKKYHIEMDVRLTSQHEEFDDKKVIGATFEINKCEDCNG